MIDGTRKLYCPRDAGDLAVALSLLEAEGIDCFVHNDHFGSLEAGMSIAGFNRKTIIVAEHDFERARDLLTPFACRSATTTDAAEYSLADRIRMAFEVFLFGWIMPGRRPSPAIASTHEPEDVGG